jgi:hypothetical protein
MGEWKVTCNVIDGKRLYGVYRLLVVMLAWMIHQLAAMGV